MEAKKRFKLYKSGKLWCCAAVAFGVMAFGTVNGQADDATPATTMSQVSAAASQVATPAATTDSTTNETPESVVTAGTQTSGTAANDKTTAAATTTLNVQQASAAPVNADAVTTAAYAATNNLSTADTLDISAYQPNISEETFRQYHNQGINNVVVKLSESTGWTNGYAQQQVSRAQAAGMTVSAYHFVRFTTAAQAQAEAQLFARTARAVGLGNDTLMIADVESVPQTQYAGIVNNLNIFWQTLSSLGFNNHGVYTGLYYDRQYNVSSTVGKARTWVAMYYLDYSANATRSNYMRSLGYGAWQYTDRWGGYIDGSIDFGMFANYAGHQTTSAANLDNFNINANNNTLDVAGWFADNNNQGKGNRYVILLDQDNGNRELVRQKVNAVSRPDVTNAYPDIYGTGNSGFNASFALTGSLADAIANGHHIRVLIRYTSSADGNSDYNDHTFDGTVLNKNIAFLDNMTTSAAGIHVAGWHAADQSVVEPNQWIILIDNQTGKEVVRAKTITTKRDDVQNAYPNILNANNSGFVASFDIVNIPGLRAAIMAGHSLKAVARYSDDSQNGEGHKVDYWFNSNIKNFYNNQSAQQLETFGINGNNIVAAGWYADNRSVAAKAMYVILFDATTNRELGRQKVNSSDRQRPDIASSHNGIANADVSGFKASFSISNANVARALKNGDRLQVVARYTDDDQGGEGNYAQYWFAPQSFQSNDGYLDSMRVNSNGSIQATGWHVSNQTSGRPYHYAILYDATAGRELSRVQVENTVQRPDVQKVYPNVYNSLNSGFNVNFAGSSAIRQAVNSGHSLQVIDRYSTSQDGNSDYVDFWSPARRL